MYIIGVALFSFGIGLFGGWKLMRIWNSLNEKGRRAWVDTGKAMADMKGGIYAAEEQPQTRSHKFDEKTNRQIDQVIALVNGK